MSDSGRKCPACGDNCGKPALLDLFSGAGGAARGYQLAGFCVLGIDVKPQPHYAGCRFHQADALEYVAEHGREFDAIHASPPCQAYSRLRHLPWLKDREYWDSLPPTLAALRGQSLPWVVENVEDAPLPGAIVLCGVMFDLPVYRHRKFLSSEFLFQPDHHKHQHTIAAGHASMAKRYAESHVAGFREVSRASVAGHATGARKTGELMGIDWMARDELAQAIPPAYTEWVGRQLLQALQGPAELQIDTTGMLPCPIEGCGWKVDPGTTCPEHPDQMIGGAVQ